MNFTIKEGNYKELGAVAEKKAVTFTFCAKKDEECAILLYEKEEQKQYRILIPKEYRIGSLCSVCVEPIAWKNIVYQYEINGVIQVDPYAKEIIGREVWNPVCEKKEVREVFAGITGDCDLTHKERREPVTKDQMILYKLHVRGFSMEDTSVRGQKKGTFPAVTAKIPYLKELGITTLELMPVYEFEEADPKEALNFWGYTKGNYFAVKSSYGKKDARKEFRQLVDTLHAHHMEAVMEIYFEEKESHSLILDALRYWVMEYQVDGFHLLGNHLPVTAIVQDPLLQETKFFYTGFAPELLEDGETNSRLFVYNDNYLYPVRKMLNHLGGNMVEFAGQQRKQDVAQGFVNYISSNNGFTLADLFSYEQKHNEKNGEDNRDGNNWNFSSNCGVEGPTRKKQIREMRELRIRNAFACLLLAQGVPLLWSGDEFANSQDGNNNAYCQDNETGWINWKQAKKEQWLTDYVKELIRFRKEHPVVSSAVPMRLCDYAQKGMPDLSYHEKNAWMLEFLPEQQDIGMMYCGGYAKDINSQEDVYIAYNFHVGNSVLALPKLQEDKKWHLVMDTSLGKTPFLEDTTLLKNQQTYAISGQTVAILISQEVPKAAKEEKMQKKTKNESKRWK